jgi:NADH:ubiquinone oxidoreductase subunit E
LQFTNKEFSDEFIALIFYNIPRILKLVKDCNKTTNHMNQKHQITICLGSSCFARGNKGIVNLVKNYIKDNKLSNKVTLTGSHCFTECKNGPNMKIDDVLYSNLTEETLTDILENALI